MGTKMADDSEMRSHQETYQGFTKLLTYSTVGVVILLVLMGLFLA
jgi:hypothetical protein